MLNSLRKLFVTPPLVPTDVPKGKYDAVVQENTQLREQLQEAIAHMERLMRLTNVKAMRVSHEQWKAEQAQSYSYALGE